MSDFNKFDSDCGNTMIGFLESDSNSYQCAFATQTKMLSKRMSLAEDKEAAFIGPMPEPKQQLTQT